MKASRETLENQLEEYKAKLNGLKSFIKELKDKTTEHGTEKHHFEEDLIEAEHNIKFYEDAIAHIKNEIGEAGKEERSQTGADTILPRTVKQGIGFFVFSAVGFVTGALLGSKLKSRSGGQDQPEKKGEH